MDKKNHSYPSEILQAIDAAKKRVPKDLNGYSAFRINVASRKDSSKTSYVPFEVNLVGRGWTPVVLKFFNMKHVGKIKALNDPNDPRSSSVVADVALLFKGDYVYTRVKTNPDGTKDDKYKEQYGRVKQLICNAFVYHVKQWQAKGQHFDSKSMIIPNVKTTREFMDPKTKKKMVEKIDPPNINVQLKFKTGSDQAANTAAKTKPETQFKCPILDVRYPHKPGVKSDWVYEEAMLTDANGNRTIPVDNGNIHLFIKGGSMISGVDNMSSVCISQGKISLPSVLDVCMVLPAKPQRTSQSDFNEDDMATIGNIDDPEPVKPDSDIKTDYTDNLDEPPSDPQADDHVDSAAFSADVDEFGDAPLEDDMNFDD